MTRLICVIYKTRRPLFRESIFSFRVPWRFFPVKGFEKSLALQEKFQRAPSSIVRPHCAQIFSSSSGGLVSVGVVFIYLWAAAVVPWNNLSPRSRKMHTSAARCEPVNLIKMVKIYGPDPRARKSINGYPSGWLAGWMKTHAARRSMMHLSPLY